MVEECADKVSDLIWRFTLGLIIADINLVMQRSSGKLTEEQVSSRLSTIIQNSNFLDRWFLIRFPKKDLKLLRDSWELKNFFEDALRRDEFDDVKSYIEQTPLIDLVVRDIDITKILELEYVPKKVDVIKGPSFIPPYIPDRIVFISSTQSQMDVLKNFLKTLFL